MPYLSLRIAFLLILGLTLSIIYVYLHNWWTSCHRNPSIFILFKYDLSRNFVDDGYFGLNKYLFFHRDWYLMNHRHLFFNKNFNWHLMDHRNLSININLADYWYFFLYNDLTNDLNFLVDKNLMYYWHLFLNYDLYPDRHLLFDENLLNNLFFYEHLYRNFFFYYFLHNNFFFYEN